MAIQSKLSRYAGDTNFLLGALRRCIGAVRYLPGAPVRDAEFNRLRSESEVALAKLYEYTKAFRAEGHAALKAEVEAQKAAASESS
jgi:hypothetical protein